MCLKVRIICKKIKYQIGDDEWKLNEDVPSTAAHLESHLDRGNISERSEETHSDTDWRTLRLQAL